MLSRGSPVSPETRASEPAQTLSEADAWREIARRIEARGLVSDGLCGELKAAEYGWSSWRGSAADYGRLDAPFRRMHQRLARRLGARVYLAPPEEAAPRLAAARAFAIDAARNPDNLSRFALFIRDVRSRAGLRSSGQRPQP